MKTIISMALATGLSLASLNAAAVNRYVGTGTGCTDTTIQAAVDALAGNTSTFNVIYISRTLTYDNQDIDIDMPGKSLVIYGVAACNNTLGTQYTTVSGAGGDTDPVFKINNTDLVSMHWLNITGGDHESAFFGGGIRFEGTGDLMLEDMIIANNTAGSGGGIAMIGTGSSLANRAELVVRKNVFIANNTARYDGGGIFLRGNVVMEMFEAGSTVYSNQALGQPTGPSGSTEGGHGGGLAILGEGVARIGSRGLGSFGVISSNSALYGGGFSVETTDIHDASVFVYQTELGFPPTISNNGADIAGGGIWLMSHHDITNVNGTAGAYLLDVRLIGNVAAQGAAAYGSTNFGITADAGSTLWVNREPHVSHIPGYVGCATGQICSQITNNMTTGTNGAVIHMENEGNVDARSTLFSKNTANRMFDLDAGTNSRILSSQITDNSLTGPVFDYRDMDLPIRSTTIAGNGIGASSVFQGSNLKLSRSIVYQPGKITVSSSSGLTLVDNVVNPGNGLPGANPGYTATNPFFMDSGRGDYRLRAHSPAVDFALAVPGEDGANDILGNPRNVNLPIVPDNGNLQDAGAYERQNIGNIVLNPGFVVDSLDPLRLWSHNLNTASFSTIDRTGMAGSGSIQVTSSTGNSSTAAIQCIGIPGPGTLRLSGYAFTSQFATGDFARMRWQLHTNENTCQSAPSAFAIVNVAGPGGWRRPNVDGSITITPAQFTTNTSVLVELYVDAGGLVPNGGVFGRFDDISLTYDSDTITDRIFANGFDSP